MDGVRGILLDSSVLLSADGDDVDGGSVNRPGADYLLRKLRYSKIPFGISHEQGLSNSKECLIQEMARSYSCDVFLLSSESDISSEVAQIWEDKGGNYIHVVSCSREDLCIKGNGSGWLNVIVGSGERKPSNSAGYAVATGISSISIYKLEELPLLICQLNKKAMGKEVLTLGYVMKPSRELDFAQRGAFPMRPTQNGLIFLPLSYELPISSQLQLVDAVLHKATDEILAVDMGSSSEFSDKVTFSRNLQELQRCVKSRLDCCVIDPFDNIFPILDRLKIQQILTGLETLNVQGHFKIRAPHFLKVSIQVNSDLEKVLTVYKFVEGDPTLVDRFDEPNLEHRLVHAKLSLPNIVKPQVACGVSNAHSMAIVFKANHYKDLNVPLPAVVQEYVDHSAWLYKFYALGSKIFYAVKKSIPNADAMMNVFVEHSSKPLHFDSLRSLPIAKEQPNADNHQIDLELVNYAADWLRRTLKLTIFGFDVVVQDGTGDHVIVDVNYLPSFKEVPDDVAIPAFWDALKERIISGKSKQAS